MSKKYEYNERGEIIKRIKTGKDSEFIGIPISGSSAADLLDSGLLIDPYIESIKTVEGVRYERDILLAYHVDIYNPMRWSELTTAQKDKVKTYRQALLDITKQDPASVVWPEPPLI